MEVLAHEISHLLGFIDEYPLAESHTKCNNAQAEPFSNNIVIFESAKIGNKKSDKKELRVEILKQIPWRDLIKSTTPILTKFGHHWRIGTPVSYSKEVGLFIAETCDLNVSIDNSVKSNSTKPNKAIAYKPLFKRTQLRYFESPFPKEYIKLLTLNKHKYRMPSFHYNIALALLLQGDSEQAYYWLTEAINREEMATRKQKLITGSF